jgi:hypothetical protein
MKNFKFLFYFSISIILIGCGDDKRITIKIIETKKGYFEWFYYSLITSDGPDYIDYVNENCERTLIFSGHDINDVYFFNNKLNVKCYKYDVLEFNPIYKNQINIIENDKEMYLDKVKFSHQRDSLIRNVKLKKCE